MTQLSELELKELQRAASAAWGRIYPGGRCASGADEAYHGCTNDPVFKATCALRGVLSMPANMPPFWGDPSIPGEKVRGPHRTISADGAGDVRAICEELGTWPEGWLPGSTNVGPRPTETALERVRELKKNAEPWYTPGASGDFGVRLSICGLGAAILRRVCEKVGFDPRFRGLQALEAALDAKDEKIRELEKRVRELEARAVPEKPSESLSDLGVAAKQAFLRAYKEAGFTVEYPWLTVGIGMDEITEVIANLKKKVPEKHYCAGFDGITFDSNGAAQLRTLADAVGYGLEDKDVHVGYALMNIRFKVEALQKKSAGDTMSHWTDAPDGLDGRIGWVSIKQLKGLYADLGVGVKTGLGNISNLRTAVETLKEKADKLDKLRADLGAT